MAMRWRRFAARFSAVVCWSCMVVRLGVVLHLTIGSQPRSHDR